MVFTVRINIRVWYQKRLLQTSLVLHNRLVMVSGFVQIRA
jgi:hypothetical protein